MNFLVYLFVLALGAIIGSFLNVVILRLNTGKTLWGRSMCFSCGKTLKWFELIPIFSFLLQKGRCRICKVKISWQYVFVELATGLLFVLIFFKFAGLNPYLASGFAIKNIIFHWVIFSILVAISAYDLRHKIIPNILVYFFIILSFIGNLVLGISSFSQILVSGLVITSPFFFLWLVSRGRWMGFGDVKLAIGFGFYLGLISGIYSILWSFWIGGGVSIVILILGRLIKKTNSESGKSFLFSFLRKLTIKSEIPFGPFMVLGLIVAFFSNWDFLHLEIILDLLKTF